MKRLKAISAELSQKGFNPCFVIPEGNLLFVRPPQPYTLSKRAVSAGKFAGSVLLAFVAGTSLITSNTLGQSIRAQRASSPDSLRQMLADGSTAMERGDLHGAEAAFRRVTVSAPTHAEGFYGLGLVELREGSFDSAIVALERAIRLNPRLAGAHVFLGIAQYQQGDAEAAMASVHAELALNPNDLEALTWSAIIALGSGHPEAAVDPIDHAATLRSDDAQILHYQVRAHSLVAEQSLARLTALDPNAAIVHQARAESLAGAGQADMAIAEYKAALGQQPGNADLLDALGEQQQKVSRFDDARLTYERELAANPASGTALYNLGKIDVEHGKPEEGVARLRKAAAVHAAAAPTDFYLGYGLAQMSEYDEARQWLEDALKHQPSPFIESAAYFQLARVYQHLGRKQDAQAALEQLKGLKAQQSPGTLASPDAAPGLDNPLQH